MFPGLDMAAFAGGFVGTMIVGEYLLGIIGERKEQRKVSERPLQYKHLEDQMNKLMEKHTQLEKKVEKYLEKKN
ncbi:hypothetical protein ACHQM5_018396 [Ranunculus cassubicifolius]